MKANPWPEPENVTFVGEDFVWKKLRMQYRTWLINDIVQVYHTEGNDHLEGKLNATKKRSFQTCRNAYWKSSYINIFLDVHHRNCGFSRCSFGFS
mgnify:CR=1 FL=1